MEKLRNRLFACGTAAFMLMNALPLKTAQTAFAAEIEAAARGDINGDGKKNSDDLDALTKLLGEHVETLFAEKQYLQYDITEDGIIDVRDRYALSQYLNGAAKELPVKPSSDLDDELTLTLDSAVCFPGDEFQVALSFVDWKKDIAAYDITIGFDTALKLKDAKFISGEGQFATGSSAVKLSALYPNDPLRRGDIAVLTFEAPADQEGEFSIQAEAANVFSSEYGVYITEKPKSSVRVQPLSEPVALKAAGIGSKSVSLKWEMPFNDQPISGYRIYRGGKQIGETSDTAYTDTKLDTDTDYEYTVSAVLENGTETAQSDTLCVHTAAPIILSAEFPADAVSDVNSDLTVKLSQTVPLSELKLDIKGPDGKTASENITLNGENLDTVIYHWGVSKLADGPYTLTVTVTDSDGTTASSETSVSVANHPLQPLTLKGEAGGRTVVLTWNLAAEAAVTGYRVYRLKEDGKTWEQIAEVTGRNTLSYTDCALKVGTTYTYAVSSTDSCEQESEKSNTVTVTPTADKTAPEITVFKPGGGQRFSGDLPVSISAADENGVKSVRCEISADNGKTWSTLCEAEGNSAEWTVHTAEQKDGVYQLRAIAVDTDGNESSGTNVISAVFDNTAPEQVSNIRIVSVSANDAVIAWDDVTDEDFDHFVAIISDNAQTSEQTVRDALGLTLNSLIPDTHYTVTVYAVDATGNAGIPSEPFRFVSNSDVTPPSITAFGVSSDYASANAVLTVRVSASDPAGIACRYLQYSQDKKNWTTLTLYSQFDSKNRPVDFKLSDNTLKKGTLYLRAYAEDKYGNKGDPETAQIHTLTVDNDAPKAPAKFTAAAEQNANVLSWTESVSEDVTGYRLERAVGTEDSAYTVLSENLHANTYTDTAVEPDGIYYYRLYAIDHAGNCSAAAKSGMVRRTPDKEKPVVTECGLTTGDLIVCSDHRSLQIMATDNNKLQNISAAYRCRASENWTALQTTETDQNEIRTELIVRTELPESILKESSVTVQVTASDTAGNKAVSEYTFPIDDRKADIIDAAAKIGERQVTVTWICKDVSAVSMFHVMRKIGTAGEEKFIGEVAASGATAFSVTDTDLTVGGSFIYSIIAFMNNGNIVTLTLDPLNVQAIPHAELEYSPSQTVGKSYNYDARASRNANDISSVRITFGDGGTAEKKSVENAVFTHTYEKAGSYEVTLTVTNASGMSDTIKRTVTVSEPDMMSGIIATVTKMDGTPAAGVAVYADVGTDQQIKRMTDADGKVQFDCTAGDHEFGVFGSGYLPVTKNASLLPNEQKELQFVITEDQLVKADFKVKRMTLDEVKAAGINVKNPENCQMVRIDVELNYTVTKTVTDHIRVYYDRSTGGYTVSGSGTGGGGGGSSSGDSGYDYYVKSISHDVTTIVLMRVPVKAQFVKEFFKVDMIVMNNAAAGFPLTDCTAALNLPSGLSLVENTPASEPRVASFGTISGGEQKTVSWIVRGDRNGDYSFSADFTAKLQPFNEPVSMHFDSEKPIHVYGQEAATITVNFEPYIIGKTLYTEVLVENRTSIDLNDLSTDIGNVLAETVGSDDEGKPRVQIAQTRFTGKDGILKIIDDSKSISVLHPGEKFSVIYAIHGVTKDPCFSIRTRTELQKRSSSGNVKVQVKPIDFASVNDPLYGIAFDPEHDFLFMVTNRKRKPISGAEIRLLKNETELIASGTTDDRGRLIVPRCDDSAGYTVQITAEGYTGYDESFAFPSSSRKSVYMETFVMSADYDEDDFALTYCSYYDDIVHHIGILNRTVMIDRTANTPFWITATSASSGTRFAIVQDGNVIASKNVNGTHVQFTDLRPSSFAVDKPVYLRISTEDGDPVDILIGIEVVEIPDPENSDPEDDPRVATMLEQIYELLSSISVFALPVPEPLKEYFGDNLDLTVNFPFIQDPKKAVTRNGHEIENKTGVSVQYVIDNGMITLSVALNNTTSIEIPTSEQQGLEFSIALTLTGELDSHKNTILLSGTLGLAVNGEIKTKAWYPFVGSPVWFLYPIYIQFTFGAGFSASASVGYTFDCSNPTKEDDQSGLYYKIDGSVNISVTGDAGFGNPDLASVSLYGSLILTVTGTLIEAGEDPCLASVTLDGSMGLRVFVLSEEVFNWAMLEHEWVLYPQSSGRPRIVLPNGQKLEDAIRTPENYIPLTAEALPAAGAWNGQVGNNVTEMQSGIALGSTPVLASDGTNCIMVWTLQDSGRGVRNASHLVFSRYDAETRTWSEPAPVDDNSNADTEPVLLAGNDGIRIAYMESADVYEDGETPDLTERAKQRVFRTAKYDAESGSFTDFRTLNANAEGGLAYAPKLVRSADGTNWLIWKSNANGLFFGTDDSNMILCAKETEDGWDTPTVLAEKLPEIGSLTCGNDAEGNPVCAYTVRKTDDEGNAFYTLYTVDLSGNGKELASGQIASPQFAEIPGKGTAGLIWYQDGGLSASTDFTNAEVLCGNQSGVTDRFAVAGDRILFLRNTEYRAEVFSMRYDAENGGFTAPVSVESGENLYYETLSAEKFGDDILYAARRTNAFFSEDGELSTESALAGGILTETADIRISSPEYSCADVAAGQALPMNVTVFNDGSDSAEAFTLRVLDPAGNEIASDTQTKAIASGSSEAVTFAPVLPAELTPAAYTVSVTSGETDRTPDNNKADLDLSKTDLEVETDITYLDNTTRVAIFARNLSSVPASAVIRIQPSSAEEETLLLFSDEIAPHSSAYWQLDSADMLGDIYRDFVSITVESETEDANESNNTACVIISQSGMDPYAIGDVDLDGAVGLEDAMLALKCYTKGVAKLDYVGFSDTQQRCADIDRNGTVDITDAMEILKYYVNFIGGNVTCSFTEYLAQQNGGAKHESE